MGNKFIPFIEWLWSKRDVGKNFHPNVLTSENVDKTLPSPALTLLEAVDLFVFMEGQNLVFPKGEFQDGFVLYSLNKIEPYKWTVAMRELNKAAFRRHPLWITVCSILTHITAGAVGAVFVVAADLVKDEIKQRWEKPSAQLPAHPSPEQSTRKTND